MLIQLKKLLKKKKDKKKKRQNLVLCPSRPNMKLHKISLLCNVFYKIAACI